MAWPKGKPRPPGAGRQAGTPNKVTAEVKEWARRILEDPDVQGMMLRTMRTFPTNVGLLIVLMHYAYGKPKESVELSGPEKKPMQFFFGRRTEPTPPDGLGDP